MSKKTHTTENEPMRRAINAAGGLKALADSLGEKQNTVSNWLQRGAPVAKCPAIEAITGVRCEELRPEVDWATFRKVLCKPGRNKR
ncbi:YdaS family helix-turn-helix protein [Cupriavidus necator]|uniref:YdaS family helix-turn-helix protein n=1 Tax=Cupriavidus necator TaxID=106590 RepID=UPI00339D88AB